MKTLYLRSVQVGLPRERGQAQADDPMDQPWTSGIFKQAVPGPVRLGSVGLEGDGQADTRNHGGPEQAVLAYSADHYPLWREELGMAGLPYGAFGENFTLSGLSEETVCIGDTLQIGPVTAQVSQPRMPCWKLERRLRVKGLVERVNATGRTGWYLRVLVEGRVEAGMAVRLQERPCPQWTIARALAAMHGRQENPEAAADLAACPLLGRRWREALARTAGSFLRGDRMRRLDVYHSIRVDVPHVGR